MAMDSIFNKAGEWFDKLGGSVDKVTSGDVGGALSGYNFSKFFFWSRLIFYFALIMGFVLVIYHFFIKYNKMAIVKRLKGNAVIDHYTSRAKITKDIRGKTKIVLLKKGKTCPIPAYPYVSKIGKKDFYTLYEDDNGELHAWGDNSLIETVAELEQKKKLIDPQVMTAWRLDEIKVMEEKFKKKNFFLEHLPEFLVFVSLLVCLGMIWIVTKMLQTSYMASAASFAEVAKNCLGS